MWDCELGQLGPLEVPPLLVAAAPVTVAEFRSFVFEQKVRNTQFDVCLVVGGSWEVRPAACINATCLQKCSAPTAPNA